MLLFTLTDEQKQAFLVLAERLMAADKQWHPAEDLRLGVMCREMGIPLEGADQERSQESLLAPFDNKRAKAILLLELISLGFADEEFNAQENAFIFDIADALGVSSEKVLEMEAWSLKKMKLAREAEAFLGEPL